MISSPQKPPGCSTLGKPCVAKLWGHLLAHGDTFAHQNFYRISCSDRLGVLSGSRKMYKLTSQSLLLLGVGYDHLGMITSPGCQESRLFMPMWKMEELRPELGQDHLSCPSPASKSSKRLGWSSLCSSFQLVCLVDGPIAGWSLSRINIKSYSWS